MVIAGGGGMWEEEEKEEEDERAPVLKNSQTIGGEERNTIKVYMG